MASLAAANRPDELTFVLVDYKGGSAFRECAELPHTLGMVTDLDAHLVERALESLGAELRAARGCWPTSRPRTTPSTGPSGSRTRRCPRCRDCCW